MAQQFRARMPGGIYTPSILLVMVVVAVSFLGVGFVMPLRALYARDELGASSAEVGLMASAFLLAGFLFTPAVGRLADRIGFKTVLWAGLLLHAGLVLLYIPARSPESLIALRALEGIATAGVLPPARALINTLAPADRQGEALGALSAAQLVGVMLGPGAGTLLAGWTGYAPTFVLAAGALVACTAAVVLALPPTGDKEEGASEGREPARAFSSPLLLAYGLRLVQMIPAGAMPAIWSLYMADRGASLPLIGLSYTTYALPYLLLSPLAGRFSDRHGRYRPIVAGLMLSGMVFLGYGFPLSPLLIIAVSVLEGVASALARTAVDGLLADATPADIRGRAQANFSAGGFLGSFIGATAAGLLYAVAPGAPFIAGGVLYLAVVAALLVPGLARAFPARSREEAAVGS